MHYVNAYAFDCMSTSVGNKDDNSREDYTFSDTFK